MKKLSERKRKWIERTVANNRSYKLYLYNRLIIILALIFLQVVLYGAMLFLVTYNSKIALALQIVLLVVEFLSLLYLVNGSDRPSMKTSWIILILVAPVIGVPAYLLYGEGRPTWRMNKKIEEAKAENVEIFLETCGEMPALESENRSDAVCRYLMKYGSFPVYGDGEVDYYKCGEDAFPVILEELKKAKKFILLDYFIVEHGKMWNEMLKILLEKAETGVQIRMIYDDFGCMTTLPPKYEKYLESLHKNVRCMTFNAIVPVFAVRMNNRDHRKILVVDGKVGFTGGINLADEYINEKERFGYWKDGVVRLKGSAVNSMTVMFFNFWNAFRKDKEDLRKYLVKEENGHTMSALKEGGLRLQPYDDSPIDKVSVAETVYLDIINRAKKYVYIFTPYLILDDSMRYALSLAARRGVDVRIVVPGIPDKKVVYRLTRANYALLQKAGVQIYEYTPGFIHSKCMVSDDECAVVGTVNFDYRSLYHHFENAVYFANCDAVADVKRDCEETFALSRLCENGYPKRNVLGRVIDSVLRVFETLF